MVHPSNVRRIVADAARLVKEGEIVVFGSASLAFWLANAPTSRDAFARDHDRLPEAPGVRVLVPHPHDVLISKLERFSDADRDHVRRILGEAPLDRDRLDALADASPYRTGEEPAASVAAFEAHFAEIRASLGD